MRLAKMAALLVIALSALGCGASPDDDMVHETVVRLSPDGKHEVRTRIITRAQSEHEDEIRRNFAAASQTKQISPELGQSVQAITNDTACLQKSVALYSTTSGSTKICFYGVGTDSLANYCMSNCGTIFQVNWDTRVRSIMAGSGTGSGAGVVGTWPHEFFEPCEGVGEGWSPGDPRRNATTCEQAATHVRLFQ